MDFQECVEFANANRICYLATTEGDQPRVRAMGMCFADETGFYFNTESPKALSKQLEQNEKVELLFHDHKGGQVMRVTGRAKISDDIALRTKIMELRPFLKTRIGVKGPEDPLLVVFQIYTGEAHFWTREYNMRESEIERIKF
jgi:pyridoxamine 5'-phosphate oxidase